MPYQFKRINPNAVPEKSQGDPLLAMAGQIAGTAVGTAVGGPMGGQIGGSIGGQLAGTGTVDPSKTAMSLATGQLTSGLSDAIGEGMVAADLGTDFGSEQTEMLYDQLNDADPDLRLTGFFNRGGPISYAACGGKMKYRAGGGPISASELEAQAIALNNDKALEEAMRMKQIEAQRAAQYNALNIDPDLTPGELYNLEQEMKRREMLERQYDANRRAHEAAGEVLPEAEQFGPMNPRFYEKGGSVSDEIRSVLDNEKLISELKLNQFGDQANMIRKQDLYTDEERYGPLKSVKYKSAGGDVYERNYYETGGKAIGNQDQGSSFFDWFSGSATSNKKPITQEAIDAEGAELERRAAEARAGAEAIGTQMPGALGGMADYMAKRRRHYEEMNKLLGK